ncbi:RCC1-like domain-containing protein [Nonomuraea polychroma]|uniref:RCC1-like domain-containing protein n=1 Tax=Nonomuraea polychroma TaxID=46176 RepID=UPI003D8CCEDA
MNPAVIGSPLVPVRVALPAGTTVTAIATGDDHTLALTSTGSLLAWGYNDFGRSETRPPSTETLRSRWP